MKHLIIIFLLTASSAFAGIELPKDIFDPFDPKDPIIFEPVMGGHESGGFTRNLAIQFGFSSKDGKIHQTVHKIIQTEMAESLKNNQLSMYKKTFLSANRVVECALFFNGDDFDAFVDRVTEALQEVRVKGPAMQVLVSGSCALNNLQK